MPVDQTPAITGSLRHGDRDDSVVREWLGLPGTGDEYGGAFFLAKRYLATLWGIGVQETSGAPEPTGSTRDETLQSQAAAIARHVPAVEIERPVVPQLSGDLLEDARAVTGLTLDQIGRATRVSGRAVAGWRAGTVPRHREAFLQQLRSIGLSLVGGLGPQNVQRWFLAGTPSRIDRLAAGEVEGVAAEARSYETSPAT
jgi:hypothetical protein